MALTSENTTTETSDDCQVIRRLRALGIDVAALAVDPLPDELWGVIEQAVRGIREKRRRWYAAAAMYGRFLSRLKAGATADELAAQFSAGPALVPLLTSPESCSTVLAADLPGPLNLLLAEVVRRTKLRPREQQDVLVELIARLRGELAEGMPVARIVENFGEPPAVAGRLRREKLNQRSALWHATRWTMRFAACLFAVTAVTIGWLEYRYFTVQRAKDVDPVEELDARASAIPVAERAWPFYAAGLEQLKLFPPPNPQTSQAPPQISAACTIGPRHADWEDAVTWLKANRTSTDLFLEGAKKPKLGFVRRDPQNDGWLKKHGGRPANETYPRQPDRLGILLPEIQAVGQYIAPLLGGSAWQAAIDGDVNQAIDCLSGLASLSGQVCAEEEFAISRIAVLSADERAIEILSHLLADHDDLFGEAELKRCRELLESGNRNLKEDLLASSRRWSRGFLAELYSADGRFTRDGFKVACCCSMAHRELQWLANLVQTKGRFDPTKQRVVDLIGPAFVPLVADRDDMLRQFDTLSKLLESDFTTRPLGEAAGGSYDREIARLLVSRRDQIRYLPLFIEGAAPWLRATLEGHWKKATERDAVRVAVAAELFRRRNDKWPESAGALVPEYLATAPLDPLDNEPLRIAIIKGRLAVYSVGFDKREDTANSTGAPLLKVDARDWQLFPP